MDKTDFEDSNNDFWRENSNVFLYIAKMRLFVEGFSRNLR